MRNAPPGFLRLAGHPLRWRPLLGPALPVVRRGVVLTLLAAAATGLLVALAAGRCHIDGVRRDFPGRAG